MRPAGSATASKCRYSKMAALFVAAVMLGCGARSQASSTDSFQPYSDCLRQSQGGADRDIVDACKALEVALEPETAEVSKAMTAKSSGKPVSAKAFFQILWHCRGERLATVAIARVYARHGVEEHGRAYALQAISWAMYDAKDSHDVLVSVKGLKDAAAMGLAASNAAAMNEDRNDVADMERLFPGVLNQAVAHLRMTRAEYDDIIRTLYSIQ